MGDTVKLLHKLLLGHAILDWIGGAVLLLYPQLIRDLTPDGFQWSPYGYRIFAAALFAVGTASYLASKHTDRRHLRDMMLWKSVWSGFVNLGIVVTFATQQQPLNLVVTVTLLVFLFGFAVWFSFYLAL